MQESHQAGGASWIQDLMGRVAGARACSLGFQLASLAFLLEEPELWLDLHF